MGWGINLYDLVKIPIRKACSGYYLRWYYNGWHYWFFLPGQYVKSTVGEKYRTYGTRKITMGTGQITTSQANAIRTIMFTREVYLLTVAGWMNIRLERDSINVYDSNVGAVEIEFVAIIGSKEITYNNGYSPVESIPIVPPAITYCEVIIGNQVWMCKNWDANYPGSKVYNNDESNRAVFGGLYSYNQVMNPGFCPAGWHVPAITEWNTMLTYISSESGRLKEIGFTHWNAPNTGAVDTYGFTALGGGWWGYFFGLGMGFYNMYEWAYFWAASPKGYNDIFYLKYNSDALTFMPLANPTNDLYASFASLRLIKDTPAAYGVVYDVDGNMYHWITIGSQRWLLENLMTTKYRDGTAIPNLTLNGAWAADVTGAYCWYDNDIANKPIYGALYNYHAVSNVHNVAPLGWRVPTRADWQTLVNYAGGDAIAAAYLKECGTTHWNAVNDCIDNVHGFTALPGGIRFHIGIFAGINTAGVWWTSEVYDATQAYLREMSNVAQNVGEDFNEFAYGKSIRCIMDV